MECARNGFKPGLTAFNTSTSQSGCDYTRSLALSARWSVSTLPHGRVGDVRHGDFRRTHKLLSQVPTGWLFHWTDDPAMKILHIIEVTFAQAFYDWALREIDPMHPDVPQLVMKRQRLADEAKRMFT